METLKKDSEKIIEAKLGKEIKSMGGWSIKLLSTFIKGLPDRMCLLPTGIIFFGEVKSTGKKPTLAQKLIHKKLKALGFNVYVIDSFDLYSADDLTYLIDNGDVHISEDDGEVFLVNSPVNLYK